jgi:error-prone DNA polymerase
MVTAAPIRLSFSGAQEGFASTLYSSSILLVRGTTRRTGDRGISINASGAWDLRSGL